ncbi:MAG: hypothetical protein HC850_15875 [Rhodomicrobium sp.]|nr:hypothetical protein [Rhodomicrobium sp.]
MDGFLLALIFTGHMTDAPDRGKARFPLDMESAARAEIAAEVELAKQKSAGSLVGIASLARGGDILFLEVLKEKQVPIRVVLPFAPETFLETSVRGAPGDWERRFWALWESLAPGEHEILDLPVSDEAFAACNRRLLELAKGIGREVGLLALWDGKDFQPKPGGTAHFIESVRALDGRVSVIDTNMLIPNRK